MVRLPFQSFGERRVHFHYYLLSSRLSPVVLVSVKVPSMGQIEQFNHLQMIIIIIDCLSMVWEIGVQSQVDSYQRL